MRRRTCKEGWLKTWMDFSEIAESPAIYDLWAGIGTVAAVLGPQVKIDQGDYYRHWANMYLALTGPSGGPKKTQAINRGMSLWREATNGEPGPKKVTAPALVKEMAERCALWRVERREDGMAPGMVDWNYLVCAPDEFGTFLDMADSSLLDTLSALYDPLEFVKLTKTQGDDKVKKPWLHIMAGVTPSWLAANFNQYSFEAGFASRCLFIYARSGEKPACFPKDCAPPDTDAWRTFLVEDLKTIREEVYGDYTFTKEAWAFEKDWYDKLWHWKEANFKGGAFDVYLNRKQSHLHKVVMCLAAAEDSRGIIELHHVKRGIELLNAVERDMPRIHTYVSHNGVGRVSEMIVEAIRRHGPLEKGALFQRVVASCNRRDFQEALSSLSMSRALQYKIDDGKYHLTDTTESESHAANP